MDELEIYKNALNLMQEYFTNIDHYLIDGTFPVYTGDNGNWILSHGNSWMEGFYPGILLNLYSYFTDNKMLKMANRSLSTLMKMPVPLTHDIGFRVYYSAARAYEITGNARLKLFSISQAYRLMGTFNYNICAIPIGTDSTAYFNLKFEDTDPETEFIIDTMTGSIPLLLWAWKATLDKRFFFCAYSHSMKVRDILIKDNYSSWQAANLVKETGSFNRHTHQGKSDNSTWARGQAWGIYGFIKMFQETGISIFRDIAGRMAVYYIKHMPDNGIAIYDFDTTNQESIDTSAGAIAACGFLDIYKSTGDRIFLDSARKIIKSSVSMEGFRGGLMHSRYRNDTGTDSEIIFGDYFLSEALIKILGVLN